MVEATLCLGDVLDSRAVVGPGERSLPTGHEREWGHNVGLQGVRSVLVGLVDYFFAGYQKNYSLGGCRGSSSSTEA